MLRERERRRRRAEFFTVKYKRYSFTILYKFIYNHSAMHFALRHLRLCESLMMIESSRLFSTGMCESFLSFYTFCTLLRSTNGKCRHNVLLLLQLAFDNRDHSTWDHIHQIPWMCHCIVARAFLIFLVEGFSHKRQEIVRSRPNPSLLGALILDFVVSARICICLKEDML